MKKSLLLFSVIAAAALIGGIIYMNSANKGVRQREQNQAGSMDTQMKNNQIVQPTTATNRAGVKEFTVTGSNFTFDVRSITVNKGDRVRITFKNSQGTHNLTIDGYNLTTKTISGGEEDFIEFTADKSGMYEFYCSVGNHRQLGMMGVLMVN